ncbi:hypothetical protein [Streptomyces sp. SS8]
MFSGTEDFRNSLFHFCWPKSIDLLQGRTSRVLASAEFSRRHEGGIMSTQYQPGKKQKISATVCVRQPGGNVNVDKIGQALGPHGVNIAGVMKEFSAATAVHSGVSLA